jgi:hypothetical protein
MPSTYSNLKIQLMSTGENNTTWGTVTNTNLGTAIEEAITGSADVTFSSANVTLTLADSNASQTARNLRLRCTGTTGGARDLIVPAIEKAYIVRNDCADTITVKNATGTGVAVPAGQSIWVFNDGTNVVNVITYLSSVALGTALPTASGGTGSTATTYCNVQTNVTGTLPTANGGTGSTATTYCNVQTNVTGTLPIANGGTGSASTTYCNVQTNVTGTLPIANGGTNATTAADARTALGATTLGANVFTLANPSAITFPRFNADNTVSALDAADFRTAIGAGAGTGTVTSVSGTGSANGLSLSGTVTSTGNITLSGSVTSVATTATIDGVIIGYRNIPRSTTTTTIAATDVGKCIAVTAGIALPANTTTFAAGDSVSIYNNSDTAITITQGSSITLYLAGTATTGNRTLAQRGIATIWFNSNTDAVISGGGVS